MPRNYSTPQIAGAALLAAAMACGAACQDAGGRSSAQPQGPTKATAQTKRKQQTQADKEPLPEPVRPEPLPAERVVDIFFTTNTDGDVDPCG
jgi:hypothetical protein